MGIEVTRVTIGLTPDGGRLKALVTVTLSDALVIRDIKVIESGGKHFVSMPSRKMNDGSYQATVYPLNREVKIMLEAVILAEFEKISGERVVRRER